MKRIETFLKANPSYTKWGDARLAIRLNLAESTVHRYKRTASFKQIKKTYLGSLN